MARVLDAYAVLAWMQGEPGSEKVAELLTAAQRQAEELVISTINAGEVYYRLGKRGYADKATAFLRDLRGNVFPWKLAAATAQRVWKAAELKTRYAISYADAFAAGLAIELNAELVTGDPELMNMGRCGVLKILPLKPSQGTPHHKQEEMTGDK